MCMSVPGRVVRIDGGSAEVERGGRLYPCNALLVPEARVGDWVLTHASLVVSVITEEEAASIEEMLREIAEAPREVF